MYIIGSNKQSPGGGRTGGAGAAARTAIDVTTETFEAEVIHRSTRTPVLVDLWATWCAPCRDLGPRLERLAAAAGGAFLLARVDVDANPDIGAVLGVRSIPAVFLFVKGRPIDAFMGAIPDAEIRQFLEKHIRLAPPVEKKGEGAVELLGGGRIREALARITRESDPLLAIRTIVLHGDEKAAREKIAHLRAAQPDLISDQLEAAERVLAHLAKEAVGERRPLEERLRREELTAVLEELLATRGEEARRLLLDLLILLGRGTYPDEFRTKLSRAVFS